MAKKAGSKPVKKTPAKQVESELVKDKKALDEKINVAAKELADKPDALLEARYRAMCKYSGALANSIAAAKHNPGA